MRAALLLALLLAGCSQPPPVKLPAAPVDRPAVPKGVSTKCELEFEPITLPTTAAEQVEGRQRDRAAATAALETCDGRRERAVRHIRRTRATP